MIYGTDDFNKLLLKMITDDQTRHSCYSIACSHADDMSVHLYGTTPSKILNRVRPREDPETKAYRIQSYETITKSTADKALSIVAKIGNPSLYHIRFGETDNAKTLEEYSMEEYPYCKSVVNYVFEVGLRKMMADANGIYVVKPSQYPENELVRVEPVIKIFGSNNVWHKDRDCYLVFIRKENVGGNGQALPTTVYYFEYYDKTQIIEFAAWSTNTKDLTLREDITYIHSFDEIPAWELKGNIEVQDDGTELYKSYFEPAVAFWNKAINHESDLDGAYINHMHPLRTELAEECDYTYRPWGQSCLAGKITNPENGVVIDCPGCYGTGYRSVKSPFGVYKYNKEKLDGATGLGVPVTYVTVPVEPTKMLEQRIEKLLEKGLYALNMDVVNKVGENQSGRAKVIDRGELYDFLYKISSVVFDTHLTNIFKYFNMYMFGVSSVNPGSESIDSSMPMIAKPVIFDISSSQELIEDYKSAKDAGISPYYLRVKQIQVNAKEFASDEDLKCYLNLIQKCDPIPDLPPDNIIAGALEGWYKPNDPIIHANIGNFIRRALKEFPEKEDKEDSGFEAMDVSEQYKVLDGYAKEIADLNKTTLVNPAIQPQGNPAGGVVDGNPDATKQAGNKLLDQRAITNSIRNAK